MSNTDKNSGHKTTIRVRKPLWALFNKECNAASIRRNEFLNRTLPAEIAQLENIPPCDAVGERWLKKMWIEHYSGPEAVLQPAPLILTVEVLDSLNAACGKTRVPRDAFIDCALRFLSARLYEAVIVIKDPRDARDIASRLFFRLFSDEEAGEKDRTQWIKEEVEEWMKERPVPPMAPDFYASMLSWNEARVDEEKQMIAGL